MADVQCKEVMLQYYIQCYIQYIQYNNMSVVVDRCQNCPGKYLWSQTNKDPLSKKNIFSPWL